MNELWRCALFKLLSYPGSESGDFRTAKIAPASSIIYLLQCKRDRPPKTRRRAIVE